MKPHFEERTAGLTSLVLNLPSYLFAAAAPLVVFGGPDLPQDALAIITVVGLVLGPVFTLSALGHSLWASRSALVPAGARRAAWLTTVLGFVGLVIGMVPIIDALGEL